MLKRVEKALKRACLDGAFVSVDVSTQHDGDQWTASGFIVTITRANSGTSTGDAQTLEDALALALRIEPRWQARKEASC